jgi:hypothetical protein
LERGPSRKDNKAKASTTVNNISLTQSSGISADQESSMRLEKATNSETLNDGIVRRKENDNLVFAGILEELDIISNSKK